MEKTPWSSNWCNIQRIVLRKQTLEVRIQSLDVFFPVQHKRPCDLPLFSFLFNDASVRSRCNSKASGSTWRCFDQDPQQAMQGGLLQSSAPCCGRWKQVATWCYICYTLTILNIRSWFLRLKCRYTYVYIYIWYMYVRSWFGTCPFTLHHVSHMAASNSLFCDERSLGWCISTWEHIYLHNQRVDDEKIKDAKVSIYIFVYTRTYIYIYFYS